MSVLVGDAVKVRCRVPNWLLVWRFVWWVAGIANRVRRVWCGFKGFSILNAAVRIVKTEFSWLVFFMFYVLFAGIHLRWRCLRFAMRRKCGVKCRNGCGFGGLRGGLRRL